MALLVSLASCKEVKIEDTELCSVAGRLRAGADCAHSLTPETRSMNLDEFIDFLEPKKEIKDEKGNIIQKERGAAICQSSDDFNKTKTALEQACYALKKYCSFEIQEALKKMGTNVDALMKKSQSKAK